MADPIYSESGFEAELNDAITSMESGDYVTARKKLFRARVIALRLPGSATSGEMSTRRAALSQVDRLAGDLDTIKVESARSDNKRFVAADIRHSYFRGDGL